MPEQFELFNQPHEDGFWSGIGGHFNNFSQVVCEFIDNSVANFIQYHLSQKTIQITLEKVNEIVKVKIEDTGTGIVDLNRSFTIGGKDKNAPSLNEHGFGLKHALATADNSNSNWAVSTRTKELIENGSYDEVSAKYMISGYYSKRFNTNEKKWPGDFHGTGTIIEFDASKELFHSLSKGIRGRTTRFSSLVNIFIEDLGFYYSGIIETGSANIVVKVIDNGNDEIYTVPSLKPEFIKYYEPAHGQVDYDLGNGEVTIKYSFGKIKPKSNAKRYYKANMSSSGVEVQINGRVIQYNIFEQIWSKEKHNSYNSLLIKINVESSDKSRLPMTRTSKNGLRMEDPKTNNLFEWIRSKMLSPKKDYNGVDPAEKDLFEELEKQKNIHLAAYEPTISLEQNVFNEINYKVPIDLYVHVQDETFIYEGKRDKTTIQDIYQLKMYWDGCVIDQIIPTQGILIAAEHSEAVREMLEIVNEFKDQNGNNYNFVLRTWQEEGVNYP